MTRSMSRTEIPAAANMSGTPREGDSWCLRMSRTKPAMRATLGAGWDGGCERSGRSPSTLEYYRASDTDASRKRFVHYSRLLPNTL